jgi:hypothetical protein
VFKASLGPQGQPERKERKERLVLKVPLELGLKEQQVFKAKWGLLEQLAL